MELGEVSFQNWRLWDFPALCGASARGVVGFRFQGVGDMDSAVRGLRCTYALVERGWCHPVRSSAVGVYM